MNQKNVFLADALAGEVVLLTGASRGIGRAILDQLAALGATVIGTATTADGAQAITQRLKDKGGSGRGAQLDVTDAAACDALVDEIVKAHGRLSVLVNNAGITRDTLALRMKDEDWAAVIDTNLSAVFRLSRAVLRSMMRAKHGRIINITSVVGGSGNAGQANYAAAKAGVAGMSRALAREVGSRGITVNCIAPGFIDTDMTRALTDQQTQTLLAQIPLGRLGQPEDIACMVAFLASPAGSYVSGATVHVNGGMFMV
ncbi:MAG: 3-oxoacyl-ACP reductase FabG [Burkholderiales bacterium]|jgi:3-oxoacyl-[acyl-carrier protein] reductase|nr:3-oxoacyl-ACP reductase FabG [Burkholderiales bacterium]